MKDYYALLEVTSEATAEEITQAYRRLVKKYHPDRYYSSRKRDNRNTWMQELNEAYGTLSQKETRQHYDKTYRQYLDARAKDAQVTLPRFLADRTRRIAKWAGVAILLLLSLKLFWAGGRFLFVTPVGKIVLVAVLFWAWTRFRPSRILGRRGTS